MRCRLSIDGNPFDFDIEGEFSEGKNEVLYYQQPSIISDCNWGKEGFHVIDLFQHEAFKEFYQSIVSILKQIIEEVGIDIPDNFQLKDYHKWIHNDQQHQEIISKTRFLTRKDFALNLDNVAKTISKQVNHPLSLTNPLLEEEIIILRINRPNSWDINPLHRDGYLDIWKDVLNVWIPIEGCNQNSSLPLVPSSHYWNEKDILRTKSKGASINKRSYHVPGIISHKDGIEMIRPNPNQGQALIFTPFLVHGAAINQNEDTTRFSLELRLCSNIK